MRSTGFGSAIPRHVLLCIAWRGASCLVLAVKATSVACTGVMSEMASITHLDPGYHLREPLPAYLALWMVLGLAVMSL